MVEHPRNLPLGPNPSAGAPSLNRAGGPGAAPPPNLGALGAAAPMLLAQARTMLAQASVDQRRAMVRQLVSADPKLLRALALDVLRESSRHIEKLSDPCLVVDVANVVDVDTGTTRFQRICSR